MVYYNEFDPVAAGLLRGMMEAGVIARGEIDTRSITEVKGHELKGYKQCHFFAGIGGWSVALRLAGVGDDTEFWTGSCPCQPFSTAGKGKGKGDERHLWPVFRDLIRECRPERVAGEQVANAVGHGWLDDLCADLEAEGYACGAVVLGAHSAGADHQRQRLYWGGSRWGGGGMADGTGERCEAGQRGMPGCGGEAESYGAAASGGMAKSVHAERRPEYEHGKDGRDGPDDRWPEACRESGACGEVPAGGMADAADGGCAEYERESGCGTRRGARKGDAAECDGDHGGMGHAAGKRQWPGDGGCDSGGGEQLEGSGPGGDAEHGGEAGGMDYAAGARCDGAECGAEGQTRNGTRMRVPDAGCAASGEFWAESRWILCRDGKQRRVPAESAFFPLADGLRAVDIGAVCRWMEGMGRAAGDIEAVRKRLRAAVRGAGRFRTAVLKGAGNAIVPQVAGMFVRAWMEGEVGEWGNR